MPQLNEIVDVEITRESRGITRIGFNTPLFLSVHTRFVDRVRAYSSLSEMVADGFLTSDVAYKQAKMCFAQDDAPDQIKIGRATAAVAQVNTITPTAVNSFLYEVTINSVVFSFTSDGSATVSEIVAGLIAAINAGSEPVTASGTTTLILTADVAGVPFTVAIGSNLANAATTPNNGPIEDIIACSAEDDDWYALTHETRTKELILTIASYVETLEKVYFPCSEEAAVKAGTEDNVADRLNELALDRSPYFYSEDQENYPECGWIGTRLALDPGSATWMFSTIKTATADTLSTTESGTIRGFEANTYETFASRNIMREGTVPSGEYVDIIIGIDYIRQRLREDIFETLANAKKVPYTDAGVAIIEAAVRARLNDAVNKGILASFTVTVPKVAAISSANKSARLLPDVEFDGILAGAIHKVEVRGRVSV